MRTNMYPGPGGFPRTEGPEPGPMEESILDAVERVISRRGVANTTLEAMAAEAGFSKGGLLHYFPNKQAILARLIDRMEKRLVKARQDRLAESQGNGEKLPKATIDSFIEMIKEDRYGMHNIAELMSDPALRARLAETRSKFFEEMCRGSRRPERVAIAMMMADGFWLDNFLESSAFPLDVRTRSINRIKEYINLLEKDFSQEKEERQTAEGA